MGPESPQHTLVKSTGGFPYLLLGDRVYSVSSHWAWWCPGCGRGKPCHTHVGLDYGRNKGPRKQLVEGLQGCGQKALRHSQGRLRAQPGSRSRGPPAEGGQPATVTWRKAGHPGRPGRATAAWGFSQEADSPVQERFTPDLGGPRPVSVLGKLEASEDKPSRLLCDFGVELTLESSRNSFSEF